MTIRKFVQIELREAIHQNKKILLLHETDHRFNAVDFAEEQDQTPDDLKFIFDEIESIAWRRRNFERKSMLEELLNRTGPQYKRHFEQREQDRELQKQQRTERRVSAITTKAMWFNELVYFRIGLAINTSIACFINATIVVCTAQGKSMGSCFKGS